jgi:hypothetical protein
MKRFLRLMIAGFILVSVAAFQNVLGSHNNIADKIPLSRTLGHNVVPKVLSPHIVESGTKRAAGESAALVVTGCCLLAVQLVGRRLLKAKAKLD